MTASRDETPKTSDPVSENITIHDGEITRSDRERRLGQRGCVVWFTGLSGSGKSTVSREVEKQLHAEGQLVQVLDGDNVRHGLCKDLGFSDEDRTENIRRIAEVCALSADVGLIVLTAFISPFQADRDQARDVVLRTVGDGRFHEVFVDTPLEVCESRDPKGLYQKVRAGEIPSFTGISSPYEAPTEPELRLETDGLTVEVSARAVLDHLRSQNLLQAGD